MLILSLGLLLILVCPINFARAEMTVDKTEKLRRKFERERNAIEAQARLRKKKPTRKPHFIDSIGGHIDSKVLSSKSSDHAVNKDRNLKSSVSNRKKINVDVTSSGEHRTVVNMKLETNTGSNSTNDLIVPLMKTLEANHVENNGKDAIELNTPMNSINSSHHRVLILVSSFAAVALSIIYLCYSLFCVYVKPKNDIKRHCEKTSVNSCSTSAEKTQIANKLALPAVVENESFSKCTFTESKKIPSERPVIVCAVLDSRLDADDTSDITDLSSDVKEIVEEVEYSEKNLDILMKQIKNAGLEPLSFIPLEKIRLELNAIFEEVNAGKPYDEKRMVKLDVSVALLSSDS